ncbi:YceD family protein [Georgenia sp. TF02-10]|uniref:YceD family protein n=1 Tax=Georgenia sp. TF02-10 TaxID=2917725 RepID=UPI001FA7D95D|nr:YceD family protein [Georgenia sp. TF02-10]UNX53846.1 YceD family protein [Georgenia sp. TF02-10]
MPARSPYVLTTRDLGRGAGGMRTIERTVPAPADLGTEVIGVPVGADVDLDLRLEAVMDGVLVTGEVHAPLVGECVRCLGAVRAETTVGLSELFFYPSTKASLVADGDEEAAELPEVDGEQVDVEPAVRDAVVLALPFQPLCRPDCPGLCQDCGVPLADAEPGHHHEHLDPRWAALGALLPDGGEAADREDGDEAR